MYQNKETDVIAANVADLRAMFPQVSIPDSPSAEDLSILGVVEIEPLPYIAPPADRKPIVIAALAAIDAKSIRPLRSGDADYLASLEAQALALRAELATL